MSEVPRFFADKNYFDTTLPSKEKESYFELDNFGLILPEYYRGSWPKDNKLEGLSNLKIATVLTLYSSSDSSEVQRLDELDHILSRKGIGHIAVDIIEVESYFTAASLLGEISKPSYLHCSAGANRTSIVTVIFSLMHLQSIGEKVDCSLLGGLVSEAISFGFDYHKPARKKDMEDALQLAMVRGLIQQ